MPRPPVPQAKHLQYVSGVSVSSYWLSAYAWDLINSSIPIILTVIIFAIFNVEAYSGTGLAAVFIILVSSKLRSLHLWFVCLFVC